MEWTERKAVITLDRSDFKNSHGVDLFNDLILDGLGIDRKKHDDIDRVDIKIDGYSL